MPPPRIPVTIVDPPETLRRLGRIQDKLDLLLGKVTAMASKIAELRSEFVEQMKKVSEIAADQKDLLARIENGNSTEAAAALEEAKAVTAKLTEVAAAYTPPTEGTGETGSGDPA